MIGRLVRHRGFMGTRFVLGAIMVAIMLLTPGCVDNEHEEEISPCVDEGILEYWVSDITSTSATICWNTDTASTSAVGYASWPDLEFTWTPEEETMTTEHRVTVTSLSPNTTYYYALAGRASLESSLCQTYEGVPFQTLP